MSLTRIEAHNLKSFRDLDVSLGALNVLIGANASGKSILCNCSALYAI
jgi:predicted ATPase